MLEGTPESIEAGMVLRGECIGAPCIYWKRERWMYPGYGKCYMGSGARSPQARKIGDRCPYATWSPHYPFYNVRWSGMPADTSKERGTDG